METWVAILMSCVALLISTVTWYNTHRQKKYDVADALLLDILKLQLQYPKFRNEEYCKELIKKSKEGEGSDEEWLRYDTFASITWNVLETLYDKYGERGLKNTPFYPAMRMLGRRHKSWLFHDDKHSCYQPRLVDFLRVQD